MSPLTIEIHDSGTWHEAAVVHLLGNESEGTAAKTRMAYDPDFTFQFEPSNKRASVSLRHPISLELINLNTWPSFLLDLLPQGHALRFVEKFYKLRDLPQNYWNILLNCKMSPPGNLRVRVDSDSIMQNSNPSKIVGFSKSDVLLNNEHFIDHMISAGAPVSGSTGASGAAPKFLLRENSDGLYFADGVLPDLETKHSWLVKFPRGKHQSDYDILKSEALLFSIAKLSGLDAQGQCFFENGALFVERFDRIKKTSGEIELYGLESFYSAIGSTIYGEFEKHDNFLSLIAKHSTQPETDLAEYIARDAFSLACKNTDNHGRNFSFLKSANKVRLSPVYDMAPMAWDSEGISRSTHWQDQNKTWQIEINSLIKNEIISGDHFYTELEKRVIGLLDSWSLLQKTELKSLFSKYRVLENDWFAGLIKLKTGLDNKWAE